MGLGLIRFILCVAAAVVGEVRGAVTPAASVALASLFAVTTAIPIALAPSTASSPIAVFAALRIALAPSTAIIFIFAAPILAFISAIIARHGDIFSSVLPPPPLFPFPRLPVPTAPTGVSGGVLRGGQRICNTGASKREYLV